MAHVSNGPVTTMPGRWFPARAGHTCDTEGHHSSPSVRMMQGETDSFGCEYIDCCQECFDAVIAEPVELTVGHCDWCKKSDVSTSLKRDHWEGTSGPVYSVCTPCAAKHNADIDYDVRMYDEDRAHEDMMDNED